MSSKSTYYFCDHIYRKKKLLIDFLLKKVFKSNTLLLKQTPSVYLIQIYGYRITRTDNNSHILVNAPPQ